MAQKTKYVEENTEGLFRVRDKDYGKGEPVIVWGSCLEYDDAHALKEKIAGREMSQTVRVESMDLPLPPTAVTPKGEKLSNEAPRVSPSSMITSASRPSADPQIAAAQKAALAAARATAAAAQQRADSLIMIPGARGTDKVELAELEVPDDIDADVDELTGAVAAES